MIVFAPYRFLQAIIVNKPTFLYLEYEKKRMFKKVPLECQTVEGHIFGAVTYILFLLVGILMLLLL